MKTTLKLDPSYGETYYNLAIFLMDQKRMEDGIKLLTRCVEVEPYHLKARFALGNTLYWQGKFDLARTHLEQNRAADTA